MSDTPAAVLMTAQQTCEYLGVSENTLRRWCEMGMPYIQPPGMLRRFRKADIDAYLDQLAQRSLDEALAKLLAEHTEG